MANRNSHSYRMTLLHKTTHRYLTLPSIAIPVDNSMRLLLISLSSAWWLTCLAIAHSFSLTRGCKFLTLTCLVFAHWNFIYLFWMFFLRTNFCLLFCFGDCSFSILSISLNFVFTGWVAAGFQQRIRLSLPQLMRSSGSWMHHAIDSTPL